MKKFILANAFCVLIFAAKAQTAPNLGTAA
jgi:hypothetical protein